MPEGDTVYRAARAMDAALAGRALTRFELRVPQLATVDLTGETVHGVVSRGKHLLHRIGGFTLRSHLKMEGTWHVYRPGTRWRRPAHQARAVLETLEGQVIGFSLARLAVVPTADEHELVGYLGPDLLGPDWDAELAVANLVSDPARPVGLALLDQRLIAGLGNVYRNELCFLRGVRPTRPVGEVADLRAMVELSQRLILANRDRPERTFTGSLGRGRMWVYGRGGQPCRRCGTTVEAGELGDSELELRTIAWCPRCQR